MKNINLKYFGQIKLISQKIIKPQKGLKTFIGSINSEILDQRNRNKVQNNVSKEHIEARGTGSGSAVDH